MTATSSACIGSSCATSTVVMRVGCGVRAHDGGERVADGIVAGRIAAVVPELTREAVVAKLEEDATRHTAV